MEYPIVNSIDNCFNGSGSIEITDSPAKELKNVLAHIISRDYAANTREAIIRDIRDFIEWYEESYGERFSFWRTVERDIADFRDALRRKWRAVSTVNRKLASIRILYDSAMEMGVISKNPCRKIKQLAIQWLSPKWLTRQELRKFLKEVEIRWSSRDKAMAYLMAHSGLRVGEVVRLETKDIHIWERSGYVDVLDSKGNKSRKVPLPLAVREALTEYLDERLVKYGKSSGSLRLFLWQRWPLTEIAVNKAMDIYSKASGLSVNPHRLRHTFAYAYLEANPGDIVGLAQILGHSDINTTSIYTQNRLEDLQKRVEGI